MAPRAQSARPNIKRMWRDPVKVSHDREQNCCELNREKLSPQAALDLPDDGPYRLAPLVLRSGGFPRLPLLRSISREKDSAYAIRLVCRRPESVARVGRLQLRFVRLGELRPGLSRRHLPTGRRATSRHAHGAIQHGGRNLRFVDASAGQWNVGRWNACRGRDRCDSHHGERDAGFEWQLDELE